MATDHSSTYKFTEIRNISHILRLRKIFKILVGEFGKSKIGRFGDFGCSNGFITSQIAERFNVVKAFGFDWSDNIEIAQQKHSNIEFKKLNLNEATDNSEIFDLVTCFETLEHVGNIDNALNVILASRSDTGVVLISVPIEIGFVGVVKYFLKRYLYRYELPLSCSDSRYLRALISGEYIGQFRPKAEGYGTHFGFDYRNVDKLLAEKKVSFKSFNSFSTRFYIIDKIV